jgi:menaquinone-specific isochorismate synthase
MPVTPYCKNLFQTRHDLYQFLLSCRQLSDEKNQNQTVSISLKIDPVHPVIALQTLAHPQQPSFYFEKQELENHLTFNQDGFAIAAFGTSLHWQLEGGDRFHQAKLLIESTLANAIIAGETDLPFSGPHFFCSFSFFDYSHSEQSAFPAATIFLPAFQITYYHHHCILVMNFMIHADTCLETTVDTLWDNVQAIRSLPAEPLTPLICTRPALKTVDVTSTEHFQQAVQAVLKTIQSGSLNKVVLAHAVDVMSPVAFHRVDSLVNLRRLYPDCYLFASSNGQGQHFLGASPERLIRLRNHQLITDALAGSAPRGQTTCEDAHLASSLLNTPKELHEHRVVLDFITQQLSSLGLAPQCAPLRLLQLSNIQHLQTPIHAAVSPGIHLLDIVAELHPTPAVAGVPRDLACEQIYRYESFERSLYAAPIGWVDHHGNGEFAVGIRSALIDGCHARLYAGAGIVAGSDPAREMAEVQLKLQALLQALV